MPELLSITSLRQTSPERVSIALSNGDEIASTLAVVADLRLYRGQELDEDRLEELRNEFGLYVQRLLTYEYEGENGARKMERIMETLRSPLDSFEESLLRSAERMDYLSCDTGLPASDVLSFRLSGGDQFIVRPSGTEPKLKAYLFTRADSPEEAEIRLNRLQVLVDRICG